MKALIRLCGCRGWSGPSLSAYAWRHIFAWDGPHYFSEDWNINCHLLRCNIATDKNSAKRGIIRPWQVKRCSTKTGSCIIQCSGYKLSAITKKKKKKLKKFHWGNISADIWWTVSDQAGPGIKEEVTSPSWENREKFAASREKCFLTEDTPRKYDYIISSYKPLADLFFPILQYRTKQ